MAQLITTSLLLLLLSTLCTISICGGSSSANSRQVQHLETRRDDSSITNPANFPTYTPTPTVVTVPGSQTPMNPISTPATTTVPTSPITNPTTPTQTPATNVPVMNPPTQTPGANVPATSGQSWCIARAGAPESSLQSALDYACGNGADCSNLQQGSGCYDPNTLENHASYAFNSYYQNNPAPTSCDFGGAAALVNTNPSSGACVYPSSATGTGTPASTNPPATTSSTNGASGSPYGGAAGSPYQVPATGTYGSPTSMNTSNPASGFPATYGPDSPPTGSTYPSASATLQPCTGIMILVASLSTMKLLFRL